MKNQSFRMGVCRFARRMDVDTRLPILHTPFLQHNFPCIPPPPHHIHTHTYVGHQHLFCIVGLHLNLAAKSMMTFAHSGCLGTNCKHLYTPTAIHAHTRTYICATPHSVCGCSKELYINGMNYIVHIQIYMHMLYLF